MHYRAQKVLTAWRSSRSFSRFIPSCNAMSSAGHASISPSANAEIIGCPCTNATDFNEAFCTSSPFIDLRLPDRACQIQFHLRSQSGIRLYAAISQGHQVIWRFTAITDAVLHFSSHIRVQIELAAAREICWPRIARAKVSKLAGSDRSVGGPKRLGPWQYRGRSPQADQVRRPEPRVFFLNQHGLNLIILRKIVPPHSSQPNSSHV